MPQSPQQPAQAIDAAAPAFELHALLAREQASLRAYLGQLVRGAGGVEDMLQDAMERALRYGHGVDPSAAPGAWLRRIALRVFLDSRARHGRRPLALAGREQELIQPGAEVGSGLMGREQLDQALACLSAKERGVLTRFHGAGQSIEEISRELGLPTGTIKSHLHRARLRLAHLKEQA